MKITSSFIQNFKKIFKNIGYYIFPPQCPYCDKIIDGQQILCDECFSRIRFITGNKCYRCGRPLPQSFPDDDGKLLCPKCMSKRPPYDLVRSVFIYDSFSREAILKLKYAHRSDLRHFFVNYMMRAGVDLFDKSDLIMPVPMYWKRRVKRKYNQATVLAELLSKHTKIPHSATNLCRIRHTQTQTRKSAKDRHKNMKNVFILKNPEQVQGKSILLIDDVVTTGATVTGCAKILKKHGAKAVYVLTIAQSINE